MTDPEVYTSRMRSEVSGTGAPNSMASSSADLGERLDEPENHRGGRPGMSRKGRARSKAGSAQYAILSGPTGGDAITSRSFEPERVGLHR